MTPVAEYYAEKLSAHGVSPQGVDWNSDDSQQLRFTQLLRVLAEDEREPAVLDYGCGYGALARRLIAAGRPFSYVGFDVCTPMVAQARLDVRDPRCSFTDSEGELPVSDYTVASGVFNVRVQAVEQQWREHVEQTIAALARHSRKGFAFNMLTRYADREKLREHLYYADPGEYFRLCKERWSRNVTLLHDYDLYEFTLLVRMGSEPKPLLQP
jgi:SAM-dependent methyltransferase